MLMRFGKDRAAVTLTTAAAVAIGGLFQASAGDILRGGATAGKTRSASESRSAVGAEAAAAAQVRAQDRLARTTRTVSDMRALQSSARAVVDTSGVPNGLVAGGLERYQPGEASFRWDGANAPVQSGNDVTITQTLQQAVLHWKSFNVGRDTHLRFDQSAGGADAAKWVAFNRVLGAQAPSQIRGRISADGQVYIINQNGVIFGGNSQVNARTLVASGLPINDNLIQRGLLNQALGSAYEFLFSSSGATGDVVVERGAILSSPVSADGNGGRVMLVGENVVNAGTITTPAGQTILAAGRQVGIDAHRGTSATTSDPTLRGIDVYIGDVGTGGRATNSGLIEVPRGSALIAGRSVTQAGVIESSTSVSLNGRVDLQASFGARPNSVYQPSQFVDEVLPFSPTQSGTVLLGSGSLIRILPETDSRETTVGRSLALRSVVNVEGRNIAFQPDSVLLAPNARVALRAGNWVAPSPGRSRLIQSGGQVFLGSGAMIDVSGTTGVIARLNEKIFTLQLRGAELADSPLQRKGVVRGAALTVDMRKSGTYGGREWVGTPLGDATGFEGLVERGAGALTTAGGSIEIAAGDSFVFQQGALMDVSGGWTRVEGGLVKTTRLLENGRLVDVSEATPDRQYDGIYTGESSRTHQKWGITKTFRAALAPTGEYRQETYFEGADAGWISVSAPAMVLEGKLVGGTIAGERQVRASATSSDMPVGGELRLSFRAQNAASPFYNEFPTPPTITFQTPGAPSGIPGFSVDASDQAARIPADRLAGVTINPAIFGGDQGFASLTINNEEGTIIIPQGVEVGLPAAGRLSLTASNIRVGGSVSAPGGTLEFRALNISPFVAEVLKAQFLVPTENPGRGIFTLESGARLSAAGRVQDDRVARGRGALEPFAPDGGRIRIEGFAVDLAPNSVIDVSGGFAMSATGNRRASNASGTPTFEDYGDAGSITIAAGQDPNEEYVIRGRLNLGSELRGYGANRGGTLAIQAPFIHVGGGVPEAGALVVPPDFFQRGGFENFRLSGLGAPGDRSGVMRPAVVIAPGTIIEPTAQTVRVAKSQTSRGRLALEVVDKPVGQRRPVSVAFLAPGVRDVDGVARIVRGDVIFGEGAAIRTDPGASVTLRGDTVAVLGSISAPGGSISIGGGKNSLAIFPPDLTQALTTVYLGPESRLSAAGTFVQQPDAFGRVRGNVLPGGQISVSGNIYAAAGSALDVSGASAVLDLLPAEAAPIGLGTPSPRTGLTAPPVDRQTISTRVDSDGGTIALEGGQMLFSYATLRGFAGGPTALGGELRISSGRFYPDPTTPAPVFDSNLVVTQTDPGGVLPLPGSASAIGRPVRGVGDVPLIGRGYVSVSSFETGGFDSLDLGGSVEFVGPVNIGMRRELRVASSGVLRADSAVRLSAPYVALGQVFQAPLPFADLARPFAQGPSYGSGNLSVSARWIDVGTLSLQGVGRAKLSAPDGDIRGAGVLAVAGDLVLEAGQIYPPTASAFDVVAYDYTSNGMTRPGSVTILGGSKRPLPYSAGGRLGIYASNIYQGGTLRAPFGRISLGWDGVGTAPSGLVAGTLPTTSRLVLGAGSITSISAVDSDGRGLLIPFGLSPDGETWIDPSGGDISSQGLAARSIVLSGINVATETGSVIDLRGGGDLLAYQWARGNGGTVDLLGVASEGWDANGTYRAGDLVLHSDGSTYSARRSMAPGDFASATVPDPSQGRFWAKVPESFAVVPGYSSDLAPFAPFNQRSRILDDVETNLIRGQGAGYVSGGLRPGDKVTLRASKSLPGGTYTLLPARYALLPGAVLVTPTSSSLPRSLETLEGGSLVPGYRFNSLNASRAVPTRSQQFEVLSPDVLASRATYNVFTANAFLRERALALQLDVPDLPRDSGVGVIQATQSMGLRGELLSRSIDGGRGAKLDLSSPRDFVLKNGDVPVAGAISLDVNLLNRYAVESLLIGGRRTVTGAGTTLVVNSGNITVDNRGATLRGPEVILAANNTISFATGASLASEGIMGRNGESLLLQGNGALVRVSADPDASVTRTGVTSDPTKALVIGPGVVLSGRGLTLDSSSVFSLDPSAVLFAEAYYLGSGRISLQLDNPGALLPTTGLVLGREAIARFQGARVLSLLSYSSLDIYGTGAVGSRALERLVLSAGEIRGFNQNGGDAVLRGRQVVMENRSASAGLGAVAAPSGRLVIEGEQVLLGANALSVSQFNQVQLRASQALSGFGTGSLSVNGAVDVFSPLITASAGANRTLRATGAFRLFSPGGSVPRDMAGLGVALTIEGASIEAGATVLLPSGLLTLRSTGGNVVVGGLLDVSGSSKTFYDVTRYTDGGEVRLLAENGNVILAPSSRVDVSSPAGGGSAGRLRISAPGGVVTLGGTIAASQSSSGTGGDFDLDVLSLPTTAGLSALLTRSGLVGSQMIRVRSGSVTIDGLNSSAVRARRFDLSVDQGSILVTGRIDVSGRTGGTVSLAANQNVTLANGSVVTAAAQDFDTAGKGGAIFLDSGSQRNGIVGVGQVAIQSGSLVDLSVASYLPGDADTRGSSAYEGKFRGTLHIRAPQNATFTDVAVAPLLGTISGASSILVEGYRLYDLTATGGVITSTVQSAISTNSQSFLGAAGTTTAGYTAMRNRLLGADPQGLESVFVLAPGAELINRTGNLTLGTSSSTTTSDWNLATFRFGPKRAPGVLTLRAAGDVVFFNSLSDGFTPTLASSNVGWLWSAQPTLLTGSPLPVNTQSWSYRFTAGSDLSAAGLRRTASSGPSTGSFLIGKNGGSNSVSGGANALTSSIIGSLFQVIRTGSGSIDISARGNVQFLNQLAAIYTAGTRVTNPNLDGQFVTPILGYPPNTTVVGNLGRVETAFANYPARYTMAGGSLRVDAGGNIERLTRNTLGQLVADSSRQLPNNWLLRRGYIDPQTGEFGTGLRGDLSSTSWWVNFSNFFQSLGTLGGGHLQVTAGGNISNVDGSVATNLRMTSDASHVLELGGGDLTFRAGANIDGGVYYVERGLGNLVAGGRITTNATRSPSTTNLTSANVIEDPSSWLPTTLFVGKGGFDVTAKGDVLIGPVGNPFLLPPGMTNTFWQKTYFSTFSPESFVNVTSLGGSLTWRTEAVVGSTSARSLLQVWAERQQVLSSTSSAFFQPWLRLAEDSVIPFATTTAIMPSTLKATAVSGPIALSGDLTLSPAANGTIELLAANGILGLQQGGRQAGSPSVALWIASKINVSDANPASVPGIYNPFAFRSLVVTQGLSEVRTGPLEFLQLFTDLFEESGNTSGPEVSIQKIQARHTPGNLHRNDPNPTRLYALSGDISGLSLFSPKRAQIFASRDISDIAFYIQNVSERDISIVASGRDILPYQAQTPLRSLANAANSRAISDPLAGDIQISGPGSLQVLAGRDLDLGLGRELGFGTGVGITSVGNLRNTYLGSKGASLFVGAGLGFSRGLASSRLNFGSFISEFVQGPRGAGYLEELGRDGAGVSFDSLSEAGKAELALQVFFRVLRDAGRDFAVTGNYDSGFAAIDSLFGSLAGPGEIRTRERDIRTRRGGSINIVAPGGSLTLARASSSARLAPPGIITESGGDISIFTRNNVSIGDGRIFVLRGGNQIIWSSEGDIAAGSAAKTVQSARPTQVSLDSQSAAVETDLAGLATGGGIGVLATVAGIEPGDVDLIAPSGTVDAGDAGIRASGNLSIAATQVLNADNINVGGQTSGVPSAPVVAAPNIGGLTAASSTSGAAVAAAENFANQVQPTPEPEPEIPSTITVEVLGYGGLEGEE